MSLVSPKKMGIISCPGSEYFTSKIVKHMKKLYQARYDKFISIMSQKYGESVEDISKKIAFQDDFESKKLPDPKGSVRFTLPKFQIDVKYTKFSNGEVKSEILDPVRGLEVYLVCDVTNYSPVRVSGDIVSSFSINDHLMFLFTTIQALNLAGASGVTLITPTYPYSRQHKKASREALTAALIGKMFENLGVKRIITLDIHCKEIENAFTTLHLENLHSTYQTIVKLQTIVDLANPKLTMVAPDTGAVNRNKFYANQLHIPMAMLYKERDYSIVSKDSQHSNIKSVKLLGDVKGKIAIICDDILATGGTLITAMKEIKNYGAEKIICIISLPFFNANAIEDFDKAYKEGVFYRIIGTNAVYHGKELIDKEWYIQADVSELFARVITRLHHGRSISPLLDKSINF